MERRTDMETGFIRSTLTGINLTSSNNNNSNTDKSPVVVAPDTLKLVEDGIVLVKRAQFTAQVVVYAVRLDRVRLHPNVPHFHRRVVARRHVRAAAAETHVWHTRDDLREEAAIRRVFLLLEY